MTPCPRVWVEKTTGPSASRRSNSFDSTSLRPILVSNCSAECAALGAEAPGSCWGRLGRLGDRETPGEPGRLPASWPIVPLWSSAHHPVSCWTPDSCVRAAFPQWTWWLDPLSHLLGSCLGLGDMAAVTLWKSGLPVLCLSHFSGPRARLLALSCWLWTVFLFLAFPGTAQQSFWPDLYGLLNPVSWELLFGACFFCLILDSSLWLLLFLYGCHSELIPQFCVGRSLSLCMKNFLSPGELFSNMFQGPRGNRRVCISNR